MLPVQIILKRQAAVASFILCREKNTVMANWIILRMQNGVYFTSAKRMTYKMIGGTPQLDMRYTVFGEVESGIEVVDKMQLCQQRCNSDRHRYQDVRMKMEIFCCT